MNQSLIQIKNKCLRLSKISVKSFHLESFDWLWRVFCVNVLLTRLYHLNRAIYMFYCQWVFLISCSESLWNVVKVVCSVIIWIGKKWMKVGRFRLGRDELRYFWFSLTSVCCYRSWNCLSVFVLFWLLLILLTRFNIFLLYEISSYQWTVYFLYSLFQLI